MLELKLIGKLFCIKKCRRPRINRLRNNSFIIVVQIDNGNFGIEKIKFQAFTKIQA